MLSERIAEYITWVDSDEPLDMPEWMGGSEWHADNNGISEHWDSVLLRQAQSELVQFEAENARLRDDLNNLTDNKWTRTEIDAAHWRAQEMEKALEGGGE